MFYRGELEIEQYSRNDEEWRGGERGVAERPRNRRARTIGNTSRESAREEGSTWGFDGKKPVLLRYLLWRGPGGRDHKGQERR